MNNFYILSLCWTFLFRLENTFFSRIILNIFLRYTRKENGVKIGTSISSPTCSLTHELVPFVHVKKCDIGYCSERRFLAVFIIWEKETFCILKVIRIHPVYSFCMAVFLR